MNPDDPLGLKGPAQAPSDPLGLMTAPSMDKLALAKRLAAQPQEEDQSGPGYLERLAAHVLNAGQGIPGVEAIEAGAGALGSKLTDNPMSYSQSLEALRGATGEIGGKTAAAERMMGSVATLPFLPANPAGAGALLGGADQLLSADPNQSVGMRALKTAGGAAAGALLGKGADMTLTAGRSLLSANPATAFLNQSYAANLLSRQAAKAEAAKTLFDRAIAEGQGRTGTAQIQAYLAEPDVAEIVKGLQETRAFQNTPADSPEMLDAIFKTFSDKAKAAKKGLDAFNPSKANLGRFNSRNISQAQQDMLDAMSGGGETIRSAALKHPNGTVIESPSHFQALLDANSKHGFRSGDFADGADGFVTSKGRFVGRKEGEEIAVRSGQASAAKDGAGLHSDNLSAAPTTAPMPTYREAVTEYAKHSAAEDALKKGYDATAANLHEGIPSSRTTMKTGPEVFEKWAKTATPEQSKAAVEGALAASRAGLLSKPLTTGRRALGAASSTIRKTQGDWGADVTKKGLLGLRNSAPFIQSLLGW